MFQSPARGLYASWCAPNSPTANYETEERTKMRLALYLLHIALQITNYSSSDGENKIPVSNISGMSYRFIND